MSKTYQLLRKKSTWERLYDWDFSRFAEFVAAPAETGIASATYTMTSDTDAALSIISQAISGPVVQLRIGGGTPGACYTVTVAIVTIPNNYKLDWPGKLVVYA